MHMVNDGSMRTMHWNGPPSITYRRSRSNKGSELAAYGKLSDTSMQTMHEPSFFEHQPVSDDHHSSKVAYLLMARLDVLYLLPVERGRGLHGTEI